MSECAHNFAGLFSSYTFGTDGPRLPPIKVQLTCDWCDESWDYAPAPRPPRTSSEER